MKVAIVHDYIKEYGGAERVLEELHALFPDAPVFTTVFLPQFLGPHIQQFASWDIRPSWLQRIPGKAKLISPFRLIAPFVFHQMDFSDYDVVIVSSTGAYMPNMIQKGTAVHICYCHTPPRYLYGYATARNWKKNKIVRFFGEAANHVLRKIDLKSSKNVDYFIANSHEVATRIKRFYQKDATVIYPPVSFPAQKNRISTHDRSYFLTGGRLAQPKHNDLAILACNKLHLPLKVFGKPFAGYGAILEKIAGDTISFAGEVTDDEKWNLMAHAKAFIFPSEDEDFGIVPVEAMMCGTPVIAYRSGGVQESVIEGKTGLFFDALTSQSLEKTLQKFLTLSHDWSMACQDRGAMFQAGVFRQNIQTFIATHKKGQNTAH